MRIHAPHNHTQMWVSLPNSEMAPRKGAIKPQQGWGAARCVWGAQGGVGSREPRMGFEVRCNHSNKTEEQRRMWREKSLSCSWSQGPSGSTFLFVSLLLSLSSLSVFSSSCFSLALCPVSRYLCSVCVSIFHSLSYVPTCAFVCLHQVPPFSLFPPSGRLRGPPDL